METNNYMIRNIPGENNKRKKVKNEKIENSSMNRLENRTPDHIDNQKTTYRQKQKSGGGKIAKRVIGSMGGILALLGAASQTGKAATLLSLLN